ncbi:MAG: aminotransferase class III-fold pyridoxal phosphate-dependent enzyme [bacterium]
MTTQELLRLDRAHTIYSWKPQKDVLPIMIDSADGAMMYGTDGTEYIDFCAGLLNVNLGHNNAHVKEAMKAQMEKVCYVGTMFGTEPKARLGEMVASVTPGDLDYVFYTNGGAEAIENAVKAARWYTGRHKIYSCWRSYHGATSTAIGLSGDPRRWPAEQGANGLVKFFGPYPYRCPFGSTTEEEANARALDVLTTQVMLDGPHTIAAIVMEPIVGTNGIIIPSSTFMQGVRELCDRHGIVMVIDETMAGWGRSGKWFGIEHFDVVPDIITTAKGITSGYVQLGAMIWSKKIWDYYWDHPFMGGLTYGGHALACATAIANIEEYRRLNLIEASATKGRYLEEKLLELKEVHPSVGDVRVKGLWACIELTSDRETKAELAGFADRLGNVSGEMTRIMYDGGLYCFAKWDFIFIAPPLIIEHEQIDRAVSVLDRALQYSDRLIAPKNKETLHV